MVARSSLGDMVRPFEPDGGVPGLPEWAAVHTPGHTPGHVAFFRREDRVLITGDAIVTINLNSLLTLARRKPEISGPPWYVTWDNQAAKRSIALLAGLEPWAIAGGHGVPVIGPAAANGLRALADRL